MAALSDTVTALLKPSDTEGELEGLRAKLESMNREQVAQFLNAKHLGGDRKTVQLVPLLIDEKNPESLGFFNATFGIYPEPFVSGKRNIFDGIALFYQDLIKQANTNIESASKTNALHPSLLREQANRNINDAFGYWLNMFQNKRPLVAATILTSGLRNSETQALLAPLNLPIFDQDLSRQIFATVTAYRSLMPAVSADNKFGETFVSMVSSFQETLFSRMLATANLTKGQFLTLLAEKTGSDRVSKLDEYIRKYMLSRAMSGPLFLKDFEPWSGDTAIIGYGENLENMHESHGIALGSVLRNLSKDAVFEVVAFERDAIDSSMTVKVHLPENIPLESPRSGLLGFLPVDWDRNGPINKDVLVGLQKLIKEGGLLRIKINKPEQLIMHLAQPIDETDTKDVVLPIPPIGLLWLFDRMSKASTLYSLDHDIIEDGRVVVPTYRSIRPEKEFDWQSLAMIMGLELASEAGLIKKFIENLPQIVEVAEAIVGEAIVFGLKATAKGAQFAILKGPGIARALGENALKYGEKTIKYGIKGVKLGIKGLKISEKILEIPFKLFKEAVEVVDKNKDTQWMANLIEWFSRGTGRWGPPFSHLKAPHSDTAPASIDTTALVRAYRRQIEIFTI
ncbi:hypothetical protein HY030_01635 [Candidatus Gottesmanbacteria bacterium]|nr:hypothetical protein [Candidatus Gottesmanbacteria bacterium]